MSTKKLIGKQLLTACLLLTFVFGLLAHAFIFFNPSYSHDSLLIYQSDQWLNDASDDVWQISLGRYLQPIYRAIRGEVTATWFSGAIALILLAISIYFIVRELEINSPIGIALTCGVMATYHTLTYVFATYSPWGDIYMLCLLCATAAAVLCGQRKHSWILSAILIAISMALYQSYVSVYLTLSIFLIIKGIFDGKEFGKLLRQGLTYLLAMIIGGVLYYIAYQFATRITGIAPANTHNSIASIGGTTTLNAATLLKTLFSAYTICIRDILLHEKVNLLRSMAVLLVLGLVSLLRLCKLVRTRHISGKLLTGLIAMLLLLPLAMGAVVLITLGWIHSLMLYSACLVFVFVIYLGEATLPCEKQTAPGRGKYLRMLTIVFLGFFIFNSISYANSIYTIKYLQEQGTLSVMTRIVDRIEQTEGYVPGETPIVFVGDVRRGDIVPRMDGGLQAYKGTGISAKRFSITYDTTYYAYLNYVLSYPHKTLLQAERKAVAQRPEVQAMPNYPAADAIQVFDDCLVVKLSN